MDLVPRARAAVGSIVFLVIAPSVVAGLVPWLLTGWHARGPLPYWVPLWIGGLLLIAAGVPCADAGVRALRRRGARHTAPIFPTDRLVVGGLYRYVRNPLYLAVGAIILGQAVALGQPILLPTLRRSPSPSQCLSTGTKSRLCTVSSASSPSRIAVPFRPGGRSATPGTRETSTIADSLGRKRARTSLRARKLGRLGERDRVPIRVGDVHVADAVRVGLDRFVLDVLGSEAARGARRARRRRGLSGPRPPAPRSAR